MADPTVAERAEALASMVDLRGGWVDDQVEGERFYDAELEHIFAVDWMVVAHDHDLPNAGDYVTGAIGEDPIAVVRQPDGSVKVLLNSCRHRGMKVCRGATGHADDKLVCAHQGWTYDLDGVLTEIGGRPAVQQVGEGWNLVEVPHLASAAGWILASWTDGEPNRAQQAAVADAVAAHQPRPGFERTVVKANWKLVAIAMSSRLGATHPEDVFAGPYVTSDGALHMLQPRGTDATEVTTWATAPGTTADDAAAPVRELATADLNLPNAAAGLSVRVRKRDEAPVLAPPPPLDMCGHEPPPRPTVRRSLSDSAARSLYTTWAARISSTTGRDE